jgi:Flp pilus assembly protein TadD
MPKARPFVPPLLVLFLGCTVLSGGAQAGWLDFGDKPKPAAASVQPDAKEKAPAPSANLDESIRQAQLLRLAGSYPEAIKHLSQLMMVAADDPRVVSEYGKTLAAMGRASDAVNFLTRAEQLSPTDWTVYSALGVAYDQIGNQKLAQAAYEHALAMRPGEPSILNNYALSRMLAKDTGMAQNLAGRAEMANAAVHDEKIARNIAMIRAMAPPAASGLAAAKPAPAKPETSIALNKPAPSPVSTPAPQSFTPVTQQALPHTLQPPAPPAPKVTQAPLPAPAADTRVVMQRVPVDPLAGPVHGAAKAGPVASRAPRPLQPAAKAEMATAAPKPKPDAVATAKPEIAKPDVAMAKTETAKPAPVAKPETKMAEAKPAAPGPKVLPPAPVKTAEVKPTTPEPKVLPPAPVKAASVKPAAGKADAKAEAKTDTKPDTKNGIPGLRLSANAF